MKAPHYLEEDIMSVPNIDTQNTSIQAKQKPQSTPAQSQQPLLEPTLAQKQKADLNASIIKSTQVSLGVKDQPLALLLNTALDKINEILAPELGEDAIQKTVDSGLDVSPEATAERIVSLSTAFLSAFKEQHQGEDDSEVLQSFLDIIGSGIDTGFEQARDILDGLSVLEGEVATNIDETYNLVQDKLAMFETMIAKQVTEQSEIN